ncbi:MAG: GNAT family N-acetyltransferase [Victivallales bacterium]|nr:GNAT family N-acetyltransferase [Victivallales bacterium]
MRETGYGFIHAVWIMLFNDNRFVVSAHPKTVMELEGLFKSIEDYSVIRELAFRERILDICRKHIKNASFSMGGGGPKYICLPENLNKIIDSNVKEITCKSKAKIVENLSEGGIYNLDHAIERKVAFAYYLENEPVSLCLVHETHSENTIDDVGGIFTLEKYRGRGFAKAVLAAATARIIDLGRIPLYGTSISNIASQNTAKSVGYTDYAYQMAVTQRI